MPSKRERRAKAVATKTPEITKRNPTAAEREAAQRADKVLAGQRWRFQVEYDSEEALLSSPHNDAAGCYSAMTAAFGTTASPFIDNALTDMANVLRGQKPRPTSIEINAALAFIDGAEPSNEVEAALLIQMVSTHSMAMRCMAAAAASPFTATDGGMGGLSVKLLRTFTAQIEALTKLRRGGEQIVRHIHVDNRGGQAVIAETMHTGGAPNEKIADQSQGKNLDCALGPALLGQDAAWNSLSVPRPQGEKAMPDARRQRRSAKRE
jgi:hypothetical protein